MFIISEANPLGYLAMQTKTDNIRDVIAFPKTLNGVDLMMESPATVLDEQLDDVHISIKK